MPQTSRKPPPLTAIPLSLISRSGLLPPVFTLRQVTWLDVLLFRKRLGFRNEGRHKHHRIDLDPVRRLPAVAGPLNHFGLDVFALMVARRKPQRNHQIDRSHGLE